MRLHWRLPTSSDIEHLAAVALDARRLGFGGVVLPNGTADEEPWVAVAALADRIRGLTFTVPLRPESMSPTLAAQLAANLHGASANRLLVHVVDDGYRAAPGSGTWPNHDEPYARADEFLAILQGAWSGVPLDYFGRHYRVAGATVATPPQPPPVIIYGGTSDLTVRISARHADVHLVGTAPPATVAERIDRVGRYAAVYGRQVSFGLRVRVIARQTAAQAWTEAERLLYAVDARSLAAARERFRLSIPVSQQQLIARHGGCVDRLEAYPNVWAGLELLRSGAGLVFVGSHEEVARRMEEYHTLGVEHFFLAEPPDGPEQAAGSRADWFGEGVLPVLRRRGLLEPEERELAEAASAG